MWREGWVTGGRTRFFVRAMGHGDDVVLLLHGWPETSEMWERVALPLVDLGYRVVAPDLKGFGRSDAPRTGYDPETLADEIAQLIRNLHAREAVVVGHDWGGGVALATAFRHPGRVRSVVIVDSPYRRIDLRAAWHIPLFNLPVLPELAFRLAPRLLVRAGLRTAARVPEAFPEDLVDRYAEAVSEHPATWLAYYRTMSRRQALAGLRGALRRRSTPADEPARLRVPALVIWGREDPALPLDIGRGVARDLGAKLVVLDGVGHFPPEEDPLGVARAIARFAGRPTRPRETAEEAV